MRLLISVKLLIAFVVVGLVPLGIVGTVSLQDAKDIGYGAAKDSENLGKEVVSDTTEAITELVGDGFLRLAGRLVENIQHNLFERENDVRTLAELVASITEDSTQIQHMFTAWSKGKRARIWYNSHTDLEPKEERQIIPLYSELAFIGVDGMERVRVVNDQPVDELRDVSKVENTTFKNETYFEKTRALKSGEVYVSRLNSWYLSTEEARDKVAKDTKAWNIVPGRDTMKSGNLRFSSPVYVGDELKGIVVLSLDYRHIQELTKHIDPAVDKTVVSTSYEGNYILMYDDKGDTIVHPKPNNIRGYLKDGKLEHRNTVATPGGIFNLDKFDKSQTYKEIFTSTIKKGEHLVKSAVDVKGRNKMTISMPIPFKHGEYAETGFFGGIMLSVNTDKFYDAAERTKEKISKKTAITNARIKKSTEGIHTENTILAVTLGTVVMVIILGIGAALTISRPLKKLAQVANIISEGNVDVEIPEVKTRDEVYDLAQSIKAVLAAVDFLREELGISEDQ